MTAGITQPGAGDVAKITLTFGVGAIVGDYDLEIAARANEITRSTKRSLVVAGHVGTLDAAFGVGGVRTLPPASTWKRSRSTARDARSLPVMTASRRSGSLPGTRRAENPKDGLATERSGCSSRTVQASRSSRTSSRRPRAFSSPEDNLTWGVAGSRCYFTGSSTDRAHRLHLLPDGGLLVLGWAEGSNLSIAKLTSTGDFDTTFAKTGKKRILRAGLQEAIAIAEDSKGRIVINAICHDVSSTCIYRLGKDGELDVTFKGGIVLQKPQTTLRGMVVGANDEIYLSGRSETDETAFAALDPSGGPLQTFGTNGWLKGPGAYSTFEFLALDDGKLVSGGWAANPL